MPAKFRLLGLPVAIVSAIAAYGQNTTEQVVKQCSDAVVLIFVSDSSGRETSLGSGFIVSADGKIVTNYHVIKGADKALVKLTNGAFFPVENVLATDPEEDLAIIKVSGRNLPTVKVANSDAVQVGERVIAIGSPLGLESTVSDGIVSALRKESNASWIQTTTPVSPGNSGGPLLRLDGTVVGVVTWGLKLGQNLNFAAPSNEVQSLLSDKRPPTSLIAAARTASSGSSIQRLKDVQKIAVASFGNSDAAGLVREKLINRLAASNKLSVVDDADAAEGVLTGVVGVDVYGKADTAVLRLTTKDGRILWGAETSNRGVGSASSSIADKLAKDLLKAMSKDLKQ
jgi:S1-C subfamily serine protease